MTRTFDQHRAAEEAPRFEIHEERNRPALLDALSNDRAYAAFALGHLEDELFAHSHYWTAHGPHGESGLVMHAGGALGKTSATMGDAAAIDAILSLHPGPRAGYLATTSPEHLTVLSRPYALSEPLTMMRMSVDSASFVGADGPVHRLERAHVRALNALYATGGGPTGYRGDHIEQGVYFGAFEGSRLLAVAGTHIIAPSTGVAVVGNVFTHESARNRGLAGRVTGAVTEALFDRGCPLVTLTVDPANTPAVRAYERLGYRRGPAVVEARFRRRDVLGVGSALRRWVARRRARTLVGGSEIEIAHGRTDANPIHER
jgi:GNAT superfamily N-acetyltransferase